jgi:hypothetical protein
MSAGQGGPSGQGGGASTLLLMPERRRALLFALPLICLTVAFCHLSLSFHEIEPVSYYAFGVHEPYLYRILVPALFRWLPARSLSCSTHLTFPIERCADVAALAIDWLALTAACLLLFATFRLVAARDRAELLTPALVVPLFLWMVVFDYILVPNNSMYYAYDFLQLAFFAAAAWLGASARGGYWALALLSFIGALNKEDALFLPVIAGVYAFWVERLNLRMVWALLLAAIAVLVAKYVTILYIREVVRIPMATPTLFENHLVHNLHQLLNPIAWFAWLGAFGGGVFVLAMRLRRIEQLKLMVIGLIAAYVPVIFLVGESRELRLLGPMICPVLLPVMLTVDALLYGEEPKAAGGGGDEARWLTWPLVAGAVLGIGLAAFLPRMLHRGSAAAPPVVTVALQPAATAVDYQDLVSCESTQIHGCKTSDGQDYDCLFTNMAQTRVELSDIRIWNYDGANELIHAQAIDTRFALPPGRTAHFEFHNTDANAAHGKLCRLDPQTLVDAQWANAR